jgi:hypothetical protein
MAIYVNKDIFCSVNAIDLSSYVVSVEFVQAVDAVESTAFSATSTNGHSFIGGIQNNSATITFNQDFAASKVWATLNTLVGTPTNVVMRPTSAAVGATNPTLTLSATLMSSLSPISGAVGDLASTGAISFQGGLYTSATS